MVKSKIPTIGNIGPDMSRVQAECFITEIIQGLWSEDEQKKFKKDRAKTLKPYSTKTLERYIEKYKTVISNLDLVEKYFTVQMTRALKKGEEEGKENLEWYLISSRQDIFEVYTKIIKNPTITEYEWDEILDDTDFEKIIFDREIGETVRTKLDLDHLLSYQLESPFFGLQNAPTMDEEAQQQGRNSGSGHKKSRDSERDESSSDFQTDDEAVEAIHQEVAEESGNKATPEAEVKKILYYLNLSRHVKKRLPDPEKMTNMNFLTSMYPPSVYEKARIDNLFDPDTKKLIHPTEKDRSKKEKSKPESNVTSKNRSAKMNEQAKKVDKKYQRVVKDCQKHDSNLKEKLFMFQIFKKSLKQSLDREVLASITFPTIRTVTPSLTQHIWEKTKSLQNVENTNLNELLPRARHNTDLVKDEVSLDKISENLDENKPELDKAQATESAAAESEVPDSDISVNVADETDNSVIEADAEDAKSDSDSEMHDQGTNVSQANQRKYKSKSGKKSKSKGKRR